MATSYADFKKFWQAMHAKAPKELNLWEMGFAINCVESKSMIQLHANTPDAYLHIQDAITEMAVRWNEVVNTVKKPVADKYNVLMSRVRDNKPILMPGTEFIS